MRIPFVLMLGLAGGAASARAAAQAPLVEKVAWFAGCWEGDVGGRIYEEVWLAARGGTMSGVSRTTQGGRTTGHESLRLLEEHGALVYHAHPLGQPAAKFTATELGDTLAVFANPQHDFPQRIRYRRRGADSLIARVEGAGPDGVRGIDFPMRRVPCPGS